MKITREIALAELKSLFFSPVAWLILIVFTFQAAMAFTEVFGMYVRNQELNYGVSNITMRLLGGYNGLFTSVQGYLYLYVPLLTMGLVSRELGSGSINLLYSSPVRNGEIVAGKFLSMVVYGLLMMVILGVMVGWGASAVPSFDYSLALSGLLGLFLLTCTYAAIGLFMSSLTSYQVVAAMGTLAMLAVLNFIGRVGQEYDFVREITFWLSIGGRASESINGLLCSEDVLYFVIVTGLFLSLSIARLKATRQRSRWQVSWSRYAVVVLVALGLGYFSSRPTLMVFHDATRTKQRTLTVNSQEIVRRATGGLKMTVFVNALDDNVWNGLPRNRKYDMERFSQYVRFKPEMEVEYVYYYAHTGSPSLERRYPGKTAGEIVGQFSRSANVDSMMFLSPGEIAKRVDLEPEGFRMTRLLERESGERTFLRMFDDNMRYPGETEISAALKRLVMELPLVGFVTGHGERGIDNEGDRGYFRFSSDKPFRYSLVNQGFDFTTVRLDVPVPERVGILVIADARSPFSPVERANLDEYVDRGGNLVILGDTRRQEVMNPLVERFGARFLPGQLAKQSAPAAKEEENGNVTLSAVPAGATIVMLGSPAAAGGQGEDNSQADFIVARLTSASKEVSYIHELMLERGNVVTMPGCVGLEFSTGKGFEVFPLLVSDTTGGWNELETTDFVDDTARLNPAAGEVERSYPTALALTRLVNGREQRVLIAGDADCLSNGEISIQRPRVPAANFNLIMGSFFWMSGNEVPVDVRRPTPPDGRFSVTRANVRASKFALMGVLPLVLLGACLVTWLRRRGR
jgi:ABC-2 type transport system permease protein